VLSNVVMEHHDGRDVLVNSADRDVVVSLRDLVGRRVLDDTKLAKGASLTLPAATGVRVLKMTGGELSRSFLLSGTR